MKDNSIYKILQFSDIHYNISSPEVLPQGSREIILEEAPDLIVLTGDIAVGEENLKAAKDVFEFFDGFNIPFTSVFGNHDCEFGADKHSYFKLLQTFTNSVKTPENPRGYVFEKSVGNHIIKANEDWEIYMIDDGWGIDKGIVDWYSDNLPRKNGFCFMHIPFSEIKQIYPTVSDEIKGVGFEPEEFGSVCAVEDDKGLFSAFSNSNMRAAYFGHDHLNDFQGKVGNTVLGYTRTADRYCYNFEGSYYLEDCHNKKLHHPLPTGFKSITLMKDRFRGYSRLFSGEKIIPFEYSF